MLQNMIDRINSISEARAIILDKIAQADQLIPKERIPNLTKGNSDWHAWHDFEHTVWNLGEEVRQIMKQYQALRKDEHLQQLVLDIVLNRNAKRGRQSFIMLLGYTFCAKYAPKLISQLDDEFVNGHIIYTLLRMRADGFVELVKPFTTHKKTWIRNYAIRYCDRHS